MNDNERHTPGPWIVSPEHDSASWGFTVITTEDGQEVLSVAASQGCAFITAAKADLQLMAAAPKLLEALKNALGVLFEEDLGNRWGHIIDPISSLIARAEGREP